MGQCASEPFVFGQCSEECETQPCTKPFECKCFVSEEKPIVEMTCTAQDAPNLILVQQPAWSGDVAFSEHHDAFESLSRGRELPHRTSDRPAGFGSEVRTSVCKERHEISCRARSRSDSPARVSFCTLVPEDNNDRVAIVQPSSTEMRPSIIFNPSDLVPRASVWDEKVQALSATAHEAPGVIVGFTMTAQSVVELEPQANITSIQGAVGTSQSVELGDQPLWQVEHGSLSEKLHMAEDTDGGLERDSDDLVNASISEKNLPVVANGTALRTTRTSESEVFDFVTSEKEDQVADIVLTVSPEAAKTIETASSDMFLSAEDCMTCTQVSDQEERPSRREESESMLSEANGSVEVGDIVILSRDVLPEYRNHAAIVTKTLENHCIVTVLDESRRYGVGECWPFYASIAIDSTRLRLGTRVVIIGLQNARTKHLNGRTGIISKHQRHVHPNFIEKAACPDTPQLNVCVTFDDVPGKARSALLEPRFLRVRREASASEMWKRGSENRSDTRNSQTPTS